MPQLRRRLFVVGVLDGLDFDFPDPTHLGGWRRDSLDKWEAERQRRGLLRHLTLKDALGDLPLLLDPESSDQYLRDPVSGYENFMRVGYKGALTDHEARELGEAHAALVKHVPVGGTWHNIPLTSCRIASRVGCDERTARTCLVVSIQIDRVTRLRPSSTT